MLKNEDYGVELQKAHRIFLNISIYKNIKLSFGCKNEPIDVQNKRLVLIFPKETYNESRIVLKGSMGMGSLNNKHRGSEHWI